MTKESKLCIERLFVPFGHIEVDEFKGEYHDEKGIIKQRQAIKLKEEGFTVREICEKINLGDTSVRNYLKNDFKPFETKAKYMSELNRGREWFLQF